MADNENLPEKPVSVEAGKDKKKKEKEKGKETEGVFLPVLVEFTFTFSVIVLVLLFLTMISVSLLTGTKLLDIVIRTSVTMLVIGVLLMLITRQISSDVLNASVVQATEAIQKQSDELEVQNQLEVV